MSSKIEDLEKQLDTSKKEVKRLKESLSELAEELGYVKAETPYSDLFGGYWVRPKKKIDSHSVKKVTEVVFHLSVFLGLIITIFVLTLTF